ncbi:hypothetical protein [Nitrososphaera sp.]|uniref:hypothetical protein n=1 Tax=Nitrososphaera sp. TaxID=1971748 RepID=UPI00307DF52C
MAPYVGGRRFPRAARRARKPMQDDWKKVPRGRWLKCTYGRCGFEWEYFGGRSWAECPACHTTVKVAVGQRNFRENAAGNNDNDDDADGRTS